MNDDRRPAPYITFRQVKGGDFVVFLEGRMVRRQRFRCIHVEACGVCGKEPPTFVPVSDVRMMAMCEGCIVEVLARMAFAATTAMESRRSSNGQE